MNTSSSVYELAAQTIRTLGSRTVAVAESLTGGLIGASITGVPGASAVFRGAVVSYATDIKVSVLGVDSKLIAHGGAVQSHVAAQMAAGVCRIMESDFGLAVTGVAGPQAQDGVSPGTVFIAVVTRSTEGDISREEVRELNISLDGVAPEDARAYIRSKTVEYALGLLEAMASEPVSE